MANNKEDLNELVQTVKHHSSMGGLEMNAKKTKAMVFSKSPVTPKVNLTIDNTPIEQVQKFKYLGAIMTDDSRTENEIKVRISMSKQKFSEMKNLLTSKQLTLNLRKKMLHCYIFSIFMYGSETWTLTKHLKIRSMFWKCGAYEEWEK